MNGLAVHTEVSFRKEKHPVENHDGEGKIRGVRPKRIGEVLVRARSTRGTSGPGTA